MAEENKSSELEWVQNVKELNKDLESRILEANCGDNKELKWSKLLPDLMMADILMLGQYTDKVDAAGNKTLNLIMMQKDGHVAVPFFTSPDKISVFVKPGQAQFDVMKVNTVRFFQSIQGKTAVLNPMTPYARVFSPFAMKILAAENADKLPPVPENK